jgi:hypothetical protein
MGDMHHSIEVILMLILTIEDVRQTPVTIGSYRWTVFSSDF